MAFQNVGIEDGQLRVGTVQSDLIAQWNGADTSVMAATAARIPAGWSAAVSVVADTAMPWRNSLRFAVTHDNTEATLFWMLATTPGWTGNNRSFALEFEMAAMPHVNSALIGAAFLCDTAGSFHGYASTMTLPNNVLVRIDAGTQTQAPVTGRAKAPVLFRQHVLAAKISGSSPNWVCNMDNPYMPGERRDVQTDIGGTPPASWNSLACDRIGLALHINGAAVPGPTTNFDIQSLTAKLA